ncbi:copper resistance protein CopC [Streptomyces sp. DSM 41982]|uniref:Protein YobA n=2 Tax=Streptomyces TaxID=1883 RepID=A0ABD5EA96_9ACTN|nr:copper resistance protein CopC [Streptomyces sp. DSM 41982]MDT0418359.1 copper resistance protein CopC [Streptomyces sp. DSM 41982]
MRSPAPLALSTARTRGAGRAPGGGRPGAARRRAPGGRRLALLLASLAAALLAVLAGAAPASAHAALVDSDPKQGAVLDTAPDRVVLDFSEKIGVSDNAVRVLDPSGERVDTGKLTDLSSGSRARYAVKLHAGLPDGTFTVAYQVVSADSHPVAGAFTFSIGAPSKTSAVVPENEAGGGLVGFLYDVGRYVAYAGFIVLVGGAAFVLGCWPRGTRLRALQRLVVGGWAALTAATLALLLLRGSYTGSGKFSDVFDLGALGDVLQTKPGAALVSRLLLLAVAALFIAVLFGAYARREDPAERRDLGFGLAIGGPVVAIGLASTWALAEHASAGLQTSVAMPVDILHLLAVAAWLGGLTALLVALYRDPAVESAAVDRFSRLAFTSVVVLVGTGIYQSWRQVGTWSALTDTSYGQLLLVKVGLVVVLVAVAFFSRRWTSRLAEGGEAAAVPGKGVPAARKAEPKRTEKAAVREGSGARGKAPEGGDAADPVRAAQLARQQAAVRVAKEKRTRDADPLRSGLRRSVLIEAGIAVVLLGVTTVLTTTEPGRTEEQVSAAKGASGATSGAAVSVKLPFDTGGENGKGTVQLDIDPGRSGANTVHVYIERPGGAPFDLPEVRLSLTLPEKNLGPIAVRPQHLAAGHWSASGVQIPMAGEWQLGVTVRTSDIDQVTVDKTVRIG